MCRMNHIPRFGVMPLLIRDNVCAKVSASRTRNSGWVIKHLKLIWFQGWRGGGEQKVVRSAQNGSFQADSSALVSLLRKLSVPGRKFWPGASPAVLGDLGVSMTSPRSFWPSRRQVAFHNSGRFRLLTNPLLRVDGTGIQIAVGADW